MGGEEGSFYTLGMEAGKEALARKEKEGGAAQGWSPSHLKTLTSLFTREAGRTAGIPGSKEPGLSSETQLSGPGVFAGDLVPRDRLSLSEQRVESVCLLQRPPVALA